MGAGRVEKSLSTESLECESAGSILGRWDYCIARSFPPAKLAVLQANSTIRTEMNSAKHTYKNRQHDCCMYRYRITRYFCMCAICVICNHTPCVLILGFVPDEWLEKLRSATRDVVQWSRKYTPEMTRPLGMHSDNDDLLAVSLVAYLSHYEVIHATSSAFDHCHGFKDMYSCPRTSTCWPINTGPSSQWSRACRRQWRCTRRTGSFVHNLQLILVCVGTVLCRS